MGENEKLNLEELPDPALWVVVETLPYAEILDVMHGSKTLQSRIKDSWIFSKKRLEHHYPEAYQDEINKVEDSQHFKAAYQTAYNNEFNTLKALLGNENDAKSTQSSLMLLRNNDIKLLNNLTDDQLTKLQQALENKSGDYDLLIDKLQENKAIKPETWSALYEKFNPNNIQDKFKWALFLHQKEMIEVLISGAIPAIMEGSGGEEMNAVNEGMSLLYKRLSKLSTQKELNQYYKSVGKLTSPVWLILFNQHKKFDWSQFDDSHRPMMLNLAADAGAVEIISNLLGDEEINPNMSLDLPPSFVGKTALELAIVNNHFEAVNVLINDPRVEFNEATIQYVLSKKDFNPNEKNVEGETLLMRAVKNEDVDSVKRLVEDDRINLDVTNDDNQTALDIANKGDNEDIIQVLKSHTPSFR